MARCTIFALPLLVMFAVPASAETVSVKYRGDVPLDTFQCHDIDSISFIKRVCYDAAQQYMVIKLQNTYYHYCEIGKYTVAALLEASSIGTYYNVNIKSKGGDGPFDCRTHRVPEY